MTIFILAQKQKLSMNVALICFNHLYYNCNKRRKILWNGSGWIIDLVINHTISISNYNYLAGSSYIKLPKELDHPRKWLINIQNIDDNECFKWSLVWYLNPANHHPAGVTKADKDFAKTLDSKDKFSHQN